MSEPSFVRQLSCVQYSCPSNTKDRALSTDSEMSGAASLDVQSLSPSMTVNDLEGSLKWYQDSLGFKVEQRHEREGKLRAASLSAGSARVMLNQEDGAKGTDRIKGQGMSLYFTTQQSVDALAEKFTANGGTLQVGPQDMPWGVRMISVLDPDGYKLVFAKPIPT